MTEVQYRCEGPEDAPHAAIYSIQLIIAKAPEPPACEVCGQQMVPIDQDAAEDDWYTRPYR